LKTRGYDEKWVHIDSPSDYKSNTYIYRAVAAIYDAIRPTPMPYFYIGSTKEVDANRVVFGQAVSDFLDKNLERKKDVMVIDSDLEGSTGLKVIHQRHPECFVPSGIMVSRPMFMTLSEG
jgi:deoxyxylulose-5-phosphate synthase